MSSTIDIPALLSSIAEIEQTIASMKAALGAEGVTLTAGKSKRVKKEKDPNAPKKEGNVWIKFTQRVSGLLKEAKIDTGAAPVSKQFAAALKGMKTYEEWTDADIVAAWSTWEKPAESMMAKRVSSSASEFNGDKASPAPVVLVEPKKEAAKEAAKEATKKAVKVPKKVVKGAGEE